MFPSLPRQLVSHSLYPPLFSSPCSVGPPFSSLCIFRCLSLSLFFCYWSLRTHIRLVVCARKYDHQRVWSMQLVWLTFLVFSSYLARSLIIVFSECHSSASRRFQVRAHTTADETRIGRQPGGVSCLFGFVCKVSAFCAGCVCWGGKWVTPTSSVCCRRPVVSNDCISFLWFIPCYPSFLFLRIHWISLFLLWFCRINLSFLFFLNNPFTLFLYCQYFIPFVS